MSIVEEIEFDNFEDFYNAMGPEGNLRLKLKGFVFRGQSNSEYKLLPSVLRYSKYDNKLNVYNLLMMTKLNLFSCFKSANEEATQVLLECALLSSFYRIANYSGLHVPNIDYFIFSADETFLLEKMKKRDFCWIHNNLVELAALAQHYGVPTRLLDWSFDEYIALYFAVQGACAHIHEHGDLNRKFDLWAINYRFFREQKIIPLKFIVPSYSNNRYLCAQKGVLSYFEIKFNDIFIQKKNKLVSCERNVRPMDDILETYKDMISGKVLYRITFPYTCAKQAFSFLNKMGYNASRIFPGYRGVVLEMKEKKYIYG